MHNKFDPEALTKQIAILQNTEKLNIKTAFDRPYINHYISTELEKLKDKFENPKILEFYGNDERWFEDSDLITHPDEITEGFKACKGLKIATDLDTDLGVTDPDYTEKYDIVICPQVLCYSLNPLQMLRNLRNFLKPGGYLIVTTSGPVYLDQFGSNFTLFYTLEGLYKLGCTVFGKKGFIHRAAYGNTEHVMRTLACVNHGKLGPKDFKHREKSISIIVAATFKR